MNPWEIEFAKAVAALEAAYDADRRIYTALDDETKSTWALEPMPSWPAAMRDDSPMAQARTALIDAEKTVRSIVLRRSVAIRNARNRQTAMYERGAFAATVPLVLEPIDSRPLGAARDSDGDIAWPPRLG